MLLLNLHNAFHLLRCNACTSSIFLANSSCFACKRRSLRFNSMMSVLTNFSSLFISFIEADNSDKLTFASELGVCVTAPGEPAPSFLPKTVLEASFTWPLFLLTGLGVLGDATLAGPIGCLSALVRSEGTRGRLPDAGRLGDKSALLAAAFRRFSACVLSLLSSDTLTRLRGRSFASREPDVRARCLTVHGGDGSDFFGPRLILTVRALFCKPLLRTGANGTRASFTIQRGTGVTLCAIGRGCFEGRNRYSSRLRSANRALL